MIIDFSDPHSLYPSLDGGQSGDLSQGISSTPTLRAPFNAHCGLDGVPFKLDPRFNIQSLTTSPNVNSNETNLNVNLDSFDYNFRLERSILGQN